MVLAWGAQTERPDYAYAQGLMPRVFELSDGAVAAPGQVCRQGQNYTAALGEGRL